jgi:hypothetical protein
MVMSQKSNLDIGQVESDMVRLVAVLQVVSFIKSSCLEDSLSGMPGSNNETRQGEFIIWLGQQYHYILLVSLLPFMAKLVRRNTYTGWTGFSKTTLAPIQRDGTVKLWFQDHEESSLVSTVAILNIIGAMWSISEAGVRNSFPHSKSLE